MKRLWIIPLLALLLTACRTTQQVPTAGQAPDADALAGNAAAFVQKVAANGQTAQTLTARIKMDLNTGGNAVSANGTLRMKRDDVIQLSLTFLGIEVGRMEFTPDGVLLIDRMGKQYVRGAYADVSFLRQAGLDFYALQSLFWNELFVPGQQGAADAASRFGLSQSGQQVLLSLTDTPKLNYTFAAQARSGSLEGVYVVDRSGQPGSFSWTYADFADFNGKPFPTVMTCAVNGTDLNVGFTLKLSRLGNDTGWATRTEVPGKYAERDADEILRKLTSH